MAYHYDNTTLGPRCPIRTTLEMLGGKWRLLILHHLTQGPLRFGQLQLAIPDISEKVLTTELRTLADNGLVLRKSYGEVPPRVEYSLTAIGQSAAALVAPIAAFGLAYQDHVLADAATAAPPIKTPA